MKTVRIAVVVDIYTGFLLSAYVMGDDGSENRAQRAYVMGDDDSEYTAHQIAMSSRTDDDGHGSVDRLTIGNDADVIPDMEQFNDNDEEGTSSRLVSISTSPPWGYYDDADDIPELVDADDAADDETQEPTACWCFHLSSDSSKFFCALNRVMLGVIQVSFR